MVGWLLGKNRRSHQETFVLRFISVICRFKNSAPRCMSCRIISIYDQLTVGGNTEALTPAHFLLGASEIRGIISPAVTGDDTGNISRAWRHQQRVARGLINRWNTEYLQTLRTWNTQTRTPLPRFPRKGDTVLVSEKAPRGRWPLASGIVPRKRQQPWLRCGANGLECPSRSYMHWKQLDNTEKRMLQKHVLTRCVNSKSHMLFGWEDVKVHALLNS